MHSPIVWKTYHFHGRWPALHNRVTQFCKDHTASWQTRSKWPRYVKAVSRLACLILFLSSGYLRDILASPSLSITIHFIHLSSRLHSILSFTMPSISASSAAPRVSSLLRRLPFYNRGPAMTSAQLLEKKLVKALISLKNPPPTMRERVKRMGSRCFGMFISPDAYHTSLIRCFAEKVRHVKKTGGSPSVVEHDDPSGPIALAMSW